jgi:hypothetical protein
MHIPDWDEKFLSQFGPKNYANMLKIAGFDQTYMKIKEIVNMVFSTDEVILDVEILPNETSETFKKKIEELNRELGLEVLVTDDHASYRDGFIDTDVERQLCLVHVLKNISKTLKKLDFSLEEKEVLMKLTRAPTKEGINQPFLQELHI